MMKILRAWSTVLLVPITFAGVAFAFPQWTQDAGLDFWHLSRFEEELEESRKTDQELSRRSEHVLQRLALREQITEDVVSGRMSLREGIEQFRHLNQSYPDCTRSVRQQFPGCTEEEATAMQLCAFIRTRIPGRSESHAYHWKAICRELTTLGYQELLPGLARMD
jgi:hypothetical protein